MIESATTTFDVRCPLCDAITRFVTPSFRELSGGNYTLTRSSTLPVELH
mgnify:FL=1